MCQSNHPDFVLVKVYDSFLAKGYPNNVSFQCLIDGIRVAGLADISVGSPGKLFIFINKKIHVNWMKVSQKKINFIRKFNKDTGWHSNTAGLLQAQQGRSPKLRP